MPANRAAQDLKDRYGRLLRCVHKGKLDVNRKQRVKGDAKVYVYDEKPFNRVRSYRGAQAVANKNDRDIWGNCYGDVGRSKVVSLAGWPGVADRPSAQRTIARSGER